LNMRFLFTLLVLIGFYAVVNSQSCHTAIMTGSVSFNEFGRNNESYVAQSGGANSLIKVNGASIQSAHNTRYYIAERCASSFEPTVFKNLNLLGRTIGFTVDLSQASCGCNAAFYLTKMPAFNSDQRPDPTKCGDYYCDANEVCGIWCPEIDLMEANTHGFHITPHRCSAPNGNYYPSCDRGGCSRKLQNGNDYGPGSQYKINTHQPFHFACKFEESNGKLSRMVSTISQDGRSIQVTHDDSCGSGYMEDLTEAVKSMVIIVSYWGDKGSGMSWLDVPPCDININCNTATDITIKDIFVK